MGENEMKMAAAESAVALIQDGMTVGLGSGSTAAFAVDVIGRRVKEGLRIRGVPTSEQTAAHARDLRIPLLDLDEAAKIDMTVDGADQVEEGSLDLVKGLGGALLREKMVASASERLVIMVHNAKLVKRLAAEGPVPVEVVPFGWETTSRRLAKLGAKGLLRRSANGEPFRSDGGNYILDCRLDQSVAAAELADLLDHVVGVVEHGLFIGMTSEVHVARSNGVHVFESLMR